MSYSNTWQLRQKLGERILGSLQRISNAVFYYSWGQCTHFRSGAWTSTRVIQLWEINFLINSVNLRSVLNLFESFDNLIEFFLYWRCFPINRARCCWWNIITIWLVQDQMALKFVSKYFKYSILYYVCIFCNFLI